MSFLTEKVSTCDMAPKIECPDAAGGGQDRGAGDAGVLEAGGHEVVGDEPDEGELQAQFRRFGHAEPCLWVWQAECSAFLIMIS